MNHDLKKAVDLLKGHSCAAVYGEKYMVSDENGIRPLINWLTDPQSPLNGAYVADKIVGRAAAFLFVYAGVKAVYGDVMSEKAMAVLQEAGIPYDYGKPVPYIINRRGDGMCPMEQKVENVQTADEAYIILKNAVQKSF